MPANNPVKTAKILSVCVARPKIVLWRGRQVSTSIFKEPVTERIPVRTLNLTGDRQADLTVHGGPEKAIYIYPSEHYPFWREQFPDMQLPFGAFGENLTTEGLLEDTVRIGDEFRMGTAVVRVTQPRLPCYKLGIRFGRADVIKRFVKSGRSGIYFSVVEEGQLAVGDEITYLTSDEHNITVSEVAALFTTTEPVDPDHIEKILNSNLALQMKQFVMSLLVESEPFE